MSITIKHLDGPLKDDPRKGEQDFDDNTRTILIGRASEAQVAYPEECTEVDNEHLILNRDEAGQYRVELCGAGEVEIDGKQSETGTKVTSGTIVTVGEGGPRFEVILPGVTIKHLEGPLKGQHQYFPDGVETIVFGRPPEKTDISYPPNYTKVGRLHFSLKRKDLGNYCVELTPKHYVEIDGVEAENGGVVRSGDIFKLGNEEGPSFSVAIEQPQSAGEVTEVNKPQTSVRKGLLSTNTELQHAKKVGGYALAALATVLVVFGGYTWDSNRRHQQALAQLTQDMTAAKSKIGELAEKSIPEAAQAALQNAVYLVAKKEGT
ncbi:MAG: hypothetical protein ACRECM_05170, partial [Methyloceanibacter sp.]